MYSNQMARPPLSAADRRHGKRLGDLCAQAREHAGRSAQELAVAAKLSIDTIRSLENGRIPTPAFITVGRIADALGLSLDELHRAALNRTPRQLARRGPKS
jgi:transcriptional regulator with XRE-family HTH domain